MIADRNKSFRNRTAGSEESSENVSDDDIAQSSCDTCEKGDDYFYRCSTCSTPDLNDSKSSESLFCDCCIVSHLRKKHKVVDARGFSPALCDTHSKICDFYCCDCCEIFCYSCTMRHSRHSFQTVADEALAIRKQIFGFIDELDEISKYMKRMKTICSEISKHVNVVTKSFSAENLPETLSNSFQSAIREKSKMLTKTVQRRSVFGKETASSPNVATNFLDVSALVSRGDKVALDLKKLLQLSDSGCIEMFLQEGKDFETVLQSQRDKLGDHLYLGWELPFNNILALSLKSAIERVKYPELRKCSLEKVQLEKQILDVSERTVCWETLGKANRFSGGRSSYDGNAELLDVEMASDEISFKVFKRNFHADECLSSRFRLERYVINLCDIQTIVKANEWIALSSADGKVHFYRLHTNEKLCETAEISKTSTLVAFNYCYNSCNSFFTLWDSLSSILSVKRRIKPDFEDICCERKPQSIEHLRNEVFASIDEESNVMLYNCENGLFFQVTRLHHGLSQVDRIQKVGKNWLLMDYKMKMILVCAVNLLCEEKISFSVEKVLQLEMPSSASIERCGYIEGFLYAFADSTFFATKFVFEF